MAFCAETPSCVSDYSLYEAPHYPSSTIFHRRHHSLRPSFSFLSWLTHAWRSGSITSNPPLFPPHASCICNEKFVQNVFVCESVCVCGGRLPWVFRLGEGGPSIWGCCCSTSAWEYTLINEGGCPESIAASLAKVPASCKYDSYSVG